MDLIDKWDAEAEALEAKAAVESTSGAKAAQANAAGNPSASSQQHSPMVPPGWHQFVRNWSLRAIPQKWSDENREQEFVIQGRRAGMSARELFNSGYLKLRQYRTIGAIHYQLQKLKKNGVDVTPRTVEHQRRSAAANKNRYRRAPAP